MFKKYKKSNNKQCKTIPTTMNGRSVVFATIKKFIKPTRKNNEDRPILSAAKCSF